ncbi:UNVERIFIED_CONTAM: hypothetical protein GTU68_054335 [Idotea baltica]|nr:hypothetical protein [Idotea baltica]
MMCGAVAGSGGKRVLIVEHAKAAGEKIRISGGGRCNFTNVHCGPRNFLSENPHFCKSALAGYRPQNFVDLVNTYGIAWHEKALGQLFCDDSSKQIVAMLLEECVKVNTEIRLRTSVEGVEKTDAGFIVATDAGRFESRALVIACGGPSIPKMGATGYGYRVAEQFGLNVIEPRAGLVPLTFTDALKEPLQTLSGISVNAIVSHGKTAFEEALLFTHRGLSGPAILQISSYWSPGETVTLNLAPGEDVLGLLKVGRSETPKQSAAAPLGKILPQKLAQFLTEGTGPRLADMSDKVLGGIARSITEWTVKPAGTEGFRTAEVALGGVDTDGLSSKTMEAKSVPGLYFIGEVVDVTGHLGGHNFQWAWASGVAAGRALTV